MVALGRADLATLRLKEIDIFDGSLLVAAYPLRYMGG